MNSLRPIVLTVGPETADLPGYSHASVQGAIERVKSLGGGTVKLLAGRYELRNAVRLRCGVRLEGVGEDTHLVKAPEVCSDLVEDSDWYEDVVRVRSATGFQVGDGLVLQGEPPHGGPAGQHKVKRTITAIEGNCLYLNETTTKNFWGLTHPSTASTLFPLLWGESDDGLAVADLRLDGKRQANGLLDGNHAGCVFLQWVEGATFERIIAHDSHGDGISWQVAHDVHVLDCHLHDNANLGLHPGSGSQRPVMRGNNVHHNGLGLFFCWGVKHGLAEDNTLCDNRDYGVSIGHRDTDNLIRGNQIERNGKAGIYYRPEQPSQRLPHRNVWENNLIADNGRDAEGYGMWVRDAVAGTVIRGNQFVGGQLGIRIDPEALDVALEGNTFDGVPVEVEDLRSGG